MNLTNCVRFAGSLCVAGCLLAPVSVAMADTIYSKSGTDKNGFATKDVTVVKIAKDGDAEKLYYTTAAGAQRDKPIDDIIRMEIDSEAAFTQAETEFAKGDLKAAGEDYRRAMAGSSKEWVKHRSDLRLVSISSQLGDFQGAVAGYVEMVKKDPASAAQHKPSLTNVKPEQLGGAIATVNTGLANAKIEAKLALYPFLMELYNKNGDTNGATAAAAELKKLEAPAAMAPGKGNQAAAPPAADLTAQKQAEADTALIRAGKAMADGQFQQVITTINGASASFVDPIQQAKALYLVADAKMGMANTPESLQDAAVAYMRVVAHFKSQPGSPAADALYKTGTIEEKLNNVNEALLVYNQVINEYKGTKAEQEAQAAVARLNGPRK
jgi:TolA-binding protein